MPKILCIQYYLPSETKADANVLGFYCFSCVINHEYELMSPVSIVFIGTSSLPGVPCRHLRTLFLRQLEECFNPIISELSACHPRFSSLPHRKAWDFIMNSGFRNEAVGDL
ncbi:hypothetical protein AVEN_237634-1 [Araneus ventricosus]|uniref:Uncharacterized protein n=1 Tax=Araneus ventricosus TaxID=182803 RepID=A0A4Y2WMT0_ARAVE|nr:hypothetical protein AVEN_237634-1 [Araneus ventricosus]